MAQPVWITPEGTLGTIPEGVFFQLAMLADTDIVASVTCTATSATTNRITCNSTAGIYPGLNVIFGGTQGTVFGGISALTRYFVLDVFSSTEFSITTSEFTTTPVPLSTASGTMPAAFNQHVYFNLQAGQLPAGIQVADNGLIIGTPKAVASIQGVPSPVNRDVTSKFTVRAYTKHYVGTSYVVDRIRDRTFSLTVSGPNPPAFITPAGLIAQYYDGSLVNGLQIQYTDPDPNATVIARVVGGSLPQGLSMSTSGLITGFIEPLSQNDMEAGYSRDGQGYDEFSFDFSTMSVNSNYQFTVEITDGIYSQLRTFSIYVYSKNMMTADNVEVTADNTFVTADVTPVRPPIITNPEGSIGSVRSDNWFAYQFLGYDLDGDQINYELLFDIGDSSGIPGLVLDPKSGWLYGYIPNMGLTENTYGFKVRVSKDINPLSANEYSYSLSITGDISTGVTWLTDSDLGTINNGATSTLFVAAEVVSGIPLQYQLLSGSTSSLPQGLQLLPSGNIAGRVSFDTFALDLGTTTFDVTMNDLGISTQNTETTFDMKHTFTVQAYSVNGLVSVSKEFYITVVRAYNAPYNNLYIQAMPPDNDRAIIQNLLQNADIFQNDLLYRPDDPNFGRATEVVYYHAFGLTAATYADYVSSLYENHYWKNLVLGEIKVAQARNANDEVIYEVVYSSVIDDLLNSQGQSVSKAVTLPYPIDGNTTVYPNSLINMRDQVIDTVGQEGTVLPQWMISKQANGRVLGFVPAWPIAYAKPGKGEQIAYYIRTEFGQQLNLIDFEVDRYELDRLLSKNWDPIADSTGGAWEPTPAETYFDLSTGQTTFDGNSLRFIAPVDMYSNTQAYDKYLVFPKRTILG